MIQTAFQDVQDIWRQHLKHAIVQRPFSKVPYEKTSIQNYQIVVSLATTECFAHWQKELSSASFAESPLLVQVALKLDSDANTTWLLIITDLDPWQNLTDQMKQNKNGGTTPTRLWMKEIRNTKCSGRMGETTAIEHTFVVMLMNFCRLDWYWNSGKKHKMCASQSVGSAWHCRPIRPAQPGPTFEQTVTLNPHLDDFQPWKGSSRSLSHTCSLYCWGLLIVQKHSSTGCLSYAHTSLLLLEQGWHCIHCNVYLQIIHKRAWYQWWWCRFWRWE